MHYLNHAACGLMSDATRNTMHAYMCQEQQMGSYLAAKQVHKDIASVYQKIAQAIHARPEDIALTQGNSDGWGRIISSMDWRQGGRILVARNEWGGNLGVLMQLRAQYGVRIEEMPCNADGLVDIDALDRLLQTPTSLVVLTWFSSNSPLIQPAQTIGALCAQYRTPLLIDAAQAMGQWHIDVQALQCTALTAPGRKWLRGPRDTGFAYVHPDFLPSLHPLGADHFSRPWQTDSTWVHRTDAKKLELSESSIALRLGLSQAFDEWNAAGAAKVQEQIQERATWLRERLQTLPAVKVHIPQREHLSGIVTLECVSHSHEHIHSSLQRQGIEAALCPAAFTPWDMQARQLHSVLRFSPSYDTSWDSMAFCVDALQRALQP
ncbi:aminotransferase class V-fold PLP-dependent enzyme [Comamonas kerstersii]|uniref:aminotransferase class V-fold PLP-dependent enzyme n=1 Tax=Comamonas kerstersii TaxID=225992 RepID=UPI0026DB89A5|nr:aminotransferase class V-fold PLP-dependent enzyme [Comamonas kerstersii]